MSRVRLKAGPAALLAWLFVSPANAAADGIAAEQGHFATYSLLHEIGAETWQILPRDGGAVLNVDATLSDRGNMRASKTTLTIAHDQTPTGLEMMRTAPATGEIWSARTANGRVIIDEPSGHRESAAPPLYYVGLQLPPAALQMMMMRYWLAHGRPAQLPILRASEKALPVEIRRVGEDKVRLSGASVRVTRYTVGNLLFGREILWMDDAGRLAAVMTFAGGLPQEQVLDRYKPAFRQLVASGVRQEMANLDELGRQVRPELQGTYAIVGARLIDGTGARPVESAVVLVRNGRIAAVGAAGVVRLPKDVRIVHAEGQSLLPGLWEMHAHYSGVEFGPAMLAAGITTARDCGGEFGFLTAVRRRIDHEGALGPRLLLAGLIDSGGPLGFGEVDVETPAEGVAAVDRYADAGFPQIKIYDQIKPDVLIAIDAEAHRRGLTATGHIPKAIDTFTAVADGMDQINHLQYVSRAMQAGGKLDLGSDSASRMISLLKAKGIVVDPTDSWGEMASHPRSVLPVLFEPGLAAAPYTLRSKYEALGTSGDEAQWRERIAVNGRVIKALHNAGILIVAGNDTGLIGYGLDRELELYVAAGLSPDAALRTATLDAARAMGLDRESGSIEVGKRADLILVAGDPLVNISDIRRVAKVVRGGQLYDSIALGRSVGFDRAAVR